MKAEVPWSEMDVDGELKLRCKNLFLQSIEQKLLRKIYAWDHMPADEVVEGIIDCPMAILENLSKLSVGNFMDETGVRTYPDLLPKSTRY